MKPDRPLPYCDAFDSTDEYVRSLLDFVGADDFLRTLCGGVHILDFFTSELDLYARVLPQEWRDFFARHDIMDVLDLLMREDLSTLSLGTQSAWRDGPFPPHSLLNYIAKIRKHLLVRDVSGSQCQRNRVMKPTQKLARQVAVGMTVKKVHEVGLFAHYIDNLIGDLRQVTTDQISHLVDFGSGQNYLGRALASEPYNHSIVAIESKSHNAERAKEYDVMARLATRQKIMRNKKAFRAGREDSAKPATLPTPPPELATGQSEQRPLVTVEASLDPAIEASSNAKGRIRYVEHRIRDGDLSEVVLQLDGTSPNMMVMSLHSCGNLVHHGLRSLILNPEVKAVAMVGCCYNLLTERLGPATYKLPELRPYARNHPRLTQTSEARDPHGFPMSDRFCNYRASPEDHTGAEHDSTDRGIRLNITARMMAVQAAQNWGQADSEDFFRRHFYRALLQRIFLDRGIVGPPQGDCVGGVSPAGHSSGGTPIVIGSLRKSCYGNFVSYVRGAVAKLESGEDPDRAVLFKKGMESMTDADIEAYEVQYHARKKDLSIIWSLMAFSAGVVEAAIVVDRWLWLKEQGIVDAWVEAVFDYRLSPRNLVVVGVKP
ncbi:hypothetical protein BAUCODRAFT_226453 [Baudoinia panamericana UAMH 10762]|uniref:Methyltransferase domain-containing protein n=1 Tax=Baudoinia panamericana (strain UAMH 10762) TaxID=717646 RepID=M2MRX6_BAUPA|nr:uncharacterized protein BAUCODRAFT_226453 [Baudoinia panamericana UAMH 10762]EMC94253.1 hypothetical protein BAUCODRAFT_226453 [Baudoinia panamericana UAMH 10762]